MQRTASLRRPSIAHCAALVAVLAVVALCALLASAALAATNISGSWTCCGGGGAAAQTFVITDKSGSLSGKDEFLGATVLAQITGKLSGARVKIVTTYKNGAARGYVATFTGTVSANGKKMSGRWSSNTGRSGTWVAQKLKA